MLETKEITVTTQNKGDKVYIISKFPAVAGREIVAKYPLSAVPKLGDYAINEETMLKLMCYVSVDTGGDKLLALTTRALIDNHVPDFETLLKIEMEMMRYNTSFFQIGKISTFLDSLKVSAEQSISSMLTVLSGRLSQPIKPPSTNSKPDTP